MDISLPGYCLGVILAAVALWIYLKWRDEEPSPVMWCVYVVAILAWPLMPIWLIIVGVRVRVWLWRHFPKAQPSPQHQETLDRLRSLRGKDRY